MPENKRQHYVPQSMLRHFASDARQRQINIINLKRNKIIRGASLRDQCYRDYFYGNVTKMEKTLSKAEGLFGAIVRKIIATESIEPTDGYNIAMMVALQKSRTLRAEEEIKDMIDRMAKLMMINRVDEALLRNVRTEVTGIMNQMIGRALLLSPMTLDLKQFLLVNRSRVPFIISDNPVVATNWFCRVRLPGRSSGGAARSGLQMVMPISPKHAVLLHDSNVYTVDSVDDAILISREQMIGNLNELQWLNAYRNIYFPPGLGDEQIQRLLATERGNETMSSVRRFESVGDANLFRRTDKDEFATPTKGVASEIVHFEKVMLPKDIRVSPVRIRGRPRYDDDWSLGSPKRDPAWCQIIQDFASAVEAEQCSFTDLWSFVERHPLTLSVGPWLRRMVRRATNQTGA
jgi:hypothetical protein